MGWACAYSAGLRLEAIETWCNATVKGEYAHVWEEPKTRQRYSYTLGREQKDGAIVGKIWKWHGTTPKHGMHQAGTFRIEPDGREMRGPAAIVAVTAYEVYINGWSFGRWKEEPTEENLYRYLTNLVRKNPNPRYELPRKAMILNINTYQPVVEWNAPEEHTWTQPTETNSTDHARQP